MRDANELRRLHDVRDLSGMPSAGARNVQGFCIFAPRNGKYYHKGEHVFFRAEVDYH